MSKNILEYALKSKYTENKTFLDAEKQNIWEIGVNVRSIYLRSLVIILLFLFVCLTLLVNG